MTEQTLSVKLKADGSGLVGEFRLSGNEVEKFRRGLDSSGKTAERVNRNYKTAATGVRSISDQLQVAKRQLIAFIGVSEGLHQLKSLVNLTDDYKLVNARLKLVTDSTKQLHQVQRELFQISQDNRVALQGSIDIYARMARSTRDLKVSQAQLLQVTDTLNKSVIISGVTSEAANAALIQLGQGMASGTLRGDELRSVLEQLPRLAEAIAKGMGVTVGQLRDMGAEGEITTQMIIRSLLSQKEAVDREFKDIPVTVGQALTVLSNGFQLYIGQADAGTGATKTLAAAIIGLANNIDILASTVLTAGKILVGVFITRWVLAARNIAIFTTAVTATSGIVSSLIPLLQFGLVTAVTAVASPFKFASVSVTVFTRSLQASTAATLANIKAAGALKTAWSLFFAAWAGWEIGTWLRDNFMEARIAGLAFIGAMINGWEKMKFTGQVVWEAIKATAAGTMNVIKEAVAGYLDFIASGLEKLNATDTAAKLRGFADGLRPAEGAAETFTRRLAELREEMQNNIDANDDIIISLIQWEYQNNQTAESTKKLDDASKDLIDTTRTLTEDQQKLLDALYPENKAFDEYASNLNELYRISIKLGWSQSELDDAINRETEAFLGLNDATKEAIDNNNKLSGTAEQLAQIYDDTASSIRSSFRDTFRDMLDSGEDAFSNFGERLRNLFKDLIADMATLAIARPIIVPVVSGMGALFGIESSAQAAVINQLGGAAASSLGGGETGSSDAAGGVVSNIAANQAGSFFSSGSILETAAGYTSTYAQSLVNAAGSQQAAMLAEQTAAFGVEGGTMTAQGLSSVLPADGSLSGIGPAGASLGGLAASGLLGGLYGYNYSGTKGAVTGSAGAMIGMALGGPVGAAVGGAIGGSLFDGKRQVTGEGVQINLANSDEISGQSYTDYKKKKKLFGGTDRWRDYGELDEEIRDQVAGVFEQITMAVSDFSFTLESDFSQRIADYEASFEGTMEELADWIDDVTMDMLETALPGLDTFRRAGESVDSVMSRLSQTVSMIDSLAESISAQIRIMQGESTAADELDADIQRLWDRLAATDDIQNRIALETQLYSAIMSRYQDEMSMISQVTDSITGTLGGLAYDGLTPAQQLQVLEQQFVSAQSQTAGLTGTDLANVATQMNQLASPLLDLARDLYASGAGYQAIYDLVTGGLIDVQGQLVNEGNLLQQSTLEELRLIRGALSQDQLFLTGQPLGSHADGLAWVPHDNYMANLHEGEAVIDAGSMRALRKYGIGGDSSAVTSLLTDLISAVEKSGVMAIRIVTPDGRELKEEVIQDIRRRSSKGEIIIDANGVSS